MMCVLILIYIFIELQLVKKKWHVIWDVRFLFLVKNIVGSNNHPFIVNSTSFHVVFLFCIKANGLLVELLVNSIRMLHGGCG